jgi:hypothetical protein
MKERGQFLAGDDLTYTKLAAAIAERAGVELDKNAYSSGRKPRTYTVQPSKFPGREDDLRGRTVSEVLSPIESNFLGGKPNEIFKNAASLVCVLGDARFHASALLSHTPHYYSGDGTDERHQCATMILAHGVEIDSSSHKMHLRYAQELAEEIIDEANRHATACERWYGSDFHQRVVFQEALGMQPRVEAQGMHQGVDQVLSGLDEIGKATPRIGTNFGDVMERMGLRMKYVSASYRDHSVGNAVSGSKTLELLGSPCGAESDNVYVMHQKRAKVYAELLRTTLKAVGETGDCLYPGTVEGETHFKEEPGKNDSFAMTLSQAQPWGTHEIGTLRFSPGDKGEPVVTFSGVHLEQGVTSVLVGKLLRKIEGTKWFVDAVKNAELPKNIHRDAQI